MRGLVRDYVWTLHSTYAEHVRHLPPGERAGLPLFAVRDFTVVAAAARDLHLLAIGAALPSPVGPEVEVADEHAGISWRLRFYDPSVLPELGLLAHDDPAEVRRVLGVTDTLYHLTVAPGGGLDAHHAQHSGIALANLHAQLGRDLERLRRAMPRDTAAVDELGVCARIGLDRAAALLARELTGGAVDTSPGTSARACVTAVLDHVGRA